MKKVIAAMAVMFLVMVPLGGLWGILLKPIIGGGVEQSFIYPIYIGFIFLAGLIVGIAAVLYEEIEEIKKFQEEIKSTNERIAKQNQD